MRFPGNVVTLEDTRPTAGGVPGRCLYCKQPIAGEHSADCVAGEHSADCVVLQRPVRVRVSIEMVISACRSWDKDNIEFYWNEGSHCTDNILDLIRAHMEAQGCLCASTTVEYLEDADMEAALASGLKPE